MLILADLFCYLRFSNRVVPTSPYAKAPYPAKNSRLPFLAMALLELMVVINSAPNSIYPSVTSDRRSRKEEKNV